MKSSEQLALAQDENTPESILIELWDTSRSVKVRKAVAKNPNAGTRVLRSAARLYLEEVLENPGFSMLELFDEDPWIKNVSEAYANPDKFLNELYIPSAVSRNHQLGWACLLSPKLTSKSIDLIVLHGSVTTLKRAIKNKAVLNNIKLLYQTSLTSPEVWPFSLETLLILHKEGVISFEELYSGLSNYGVTSTSVSKSTFNKFTTYLIKKYVDTKEPFIAKLLAKFALVIRSYALGWLRRNEFMSAKFSETGSLFAEVLSHMAHSYKLAPLSKENFYIISELVSKQIRYRFFGSTGKGAMVDHHYTSDQLTQVYEFIRSHGLDSVYPALSALQFKGKFAISALIGCRDEVKEFFIRRGCIGGWVSVLGSDPKYTLVNGINEAIFLKEGISDNLLFKSCSLRKVISFNGSTHVV